MEDVLQVYQRQYGDNEVLVCLNETSKQQAKETRRPRPARPGAAGSYDYEYERNGVSNLFMLFAPLEGWRRVEVTDRRTKTDWARVVKQLVDEDYPHKDRIVLVMDNLNTHHPSSLYEEFEPAERRRRRFAVKLWPFKGSRKNQPPPPAVITPFTDDVEDTATLKYHGVRVLCGVLMDRHDACRSPHPFCGPNVHRKNGDVMVTVNAHVIPQRNPSGLSMVAIYLCQAVSELPATGEADLLEYTTHLFCAGNKPHRKMVAQLMSDGTYYVRYGTVLNPVEGDHSTGRLDQETAVELRSIPEPAYTKWEYHDIKMADGPLDTIPEFHCLQAFGEWWIVDVDREKSMRQQLAALTVADSPYHNLQLSTTGAGP